MANIVYIATSIDGYIAKKDGDIDWLHELPNPDESDFGFAQFMERVDALVMGRKSYEKVLSFDCEWPYSKKVFVLSNTLKEVDSSVSDKAEVISGDLKDIVSRLNERGYENLYIDGGKTIQSFLCKDMIDEINLSRIPVILGDGIPLFVSQDSMINFEHLKTTSFENGLVQSRYKKV